MAFMTAGIFHGHRCWTSKLAAVALKRRIGVPSHETNMRIGVITFTTNNYLRGAASRSMTQRVSEAPRRIVGARMA